MSLKVSTFFGITELEAQTVTKSIRVYVQTLRVSKLTVCKNNHIFSQLLKLDSSWQTTTLVNPNKLAHKQN